MHITRWLPSAECLEVHTSTPCLARSLNVLQAYSIIKDACTHPLEMNTGLILEERLMNPRRVVGRQHPTCRYAPLRLTGYPWCGRLSLDNNAVSSLHPNSCSAPYGLSSSTSRMRCLCLHHDERRCTKVCCFLDSCVKKMQAASHFSGWLDSAILGTRRRAHWVQAPMHAETTPTNAPNWVLPCPPSLPSHGGQPHGF